MRKWLFLVAVVFFLPKLASAQACVGFANPVVPMATETITVSNVSKALTAATYATATQTAAIAYLTFDGTNNVRWWPTGDPTNAVGHLVTASSNVGLMICGQQAIASFRMIRVTNDATVSVSYYVAR